MTTRHQPGQTRMRVCDQGDGRGRPHVINEGLFRRVLVRERKRSDRSNQPVVLLLLDLDDGLGTGSSLIWEAAIETLAAATRETDVRGRFEWRAVIGGIVSETRFAELADTRRGRCTQV